MFWHEINNIYVIKIIDMDWLKSSEQKNEFVFIRTIKITWKINTETVLCQLYKLIQLYFEAN